MANSELRVARTATEALKVLWEEKFFASWRPKGKVEEALAQKGNHFSDSELGMALMRARHLTRRGKRGHFEYIQRFPHTQGDQERRAGKKGGKK